MIPPPDDRERRASRTGHIAAGAQGTNWASGSIRCMPRRVSSSDSSASLPARERTPAKVCYELGDELRFQILWIGVRSLPPRDQNLITVCQLPHVPSSPMADRLAGAMSPVLLQALPQASSTARASTCLPDVDHVRSLDPSRVEFSDGDRGILAFEPPCGSRRGTSGGPTDRGIPRRLQGRSDG